MSDWPTQSSEPRWLKQVAAAYLPRSMPVSPTCAADPVMTYADFRALAQPPAPRTIAYGQGPLQQVELWKPEGKGTFPVILMIHGGCWQTKIAKADIMHRLAAAFVAQGVAVWNVEYRGVDVAGGGYPGTFQDVAAAADLLRERGRDFGLDPLHVVALGHSAGGHLALWLAGRHRIARNSTLWEERPLPLSGVVSIGGIPDIEDARTAAAEACGAETIDRLVGQSTSTHRDRYADTSPVSLAPLGVRQVVLSGAADMIAPPRFAQSYAAKVGAKGDTVSVATIPAQGHFELIAPGTAAGDAVIAAALHLLEQPR